MVEIQNKYQKEIEELAKTPRRVSELKFVASHGGNLSYRVAETLFL